MFKKILLAYNGSHEGRSALLACAEIASFAKSETHLLVVAGMPSSMFLTEGFLPEELLEEEKKRAQDILNEGLQQLRQKGFSVAGHLAVGEPVEEICRLAAELKCDLIVVGHKQKASFASRWWRGSVGRTLLDHAPCSIFVAQTMAIYTPGTWYADYTLATCPSSPTERVHCLKRIIGINPKSVMEGPVTQIEMSLSTSM